MQEINFIFSILILLMSVVVHEVAHGVAAEYLGDPTARNAGRLTLNPLKHIDPIGSILVPIISYYAGGFLFGWAKPVPYNPYNLRNQRWGEAIVAIAGPLTNIAIAVIFGLTLRFGFNSFSAPLQSILSLVVIINLVLATFNIMPLPPLDGSKVLFALLPYHMRRVRTFLDQYGIILSLIFVLFFWQFILPVVYILFSLITGISTS